MDKWLVRWLLSVAFVVTFTVVGTYVLDNEIDKSAYKSCLEVSQAALRGDPVDSSIFDNTLWLIEKNPKWRERLKKDGITDEDIKRMEEYKFRFVRITPKTQ